MDSLNEKVAENLALDRIVGNIGELGAMLTAMKATRCWEDFVMDLQSKVYEKKAG